MGKSSSDCSQKQNKCAEFHFYVLKYLQLLKHVLNLRVEKSQAISYSAGGSINWYNIFGGQFW